MTTGKAFDTIERITATVQGAYTMKGPDEVLTMKTLHGKGYLPWKFAGIRGSSHNTVSRYIKNRFEAAPREQRSSALDPHAEFLLERFPRH